MRPGSASIERRRFFPAPKVNEPAGAGPLLGFGLKGIDRASAVEGDGRRGAVTGCERGGMPEKQGASVPVAGTA